jgi:glutathione synthase/RimK-type ligase-like ATP-grasp enzyme
MKKLVLVPHKMGSRSAKALADVLSAKLGYKVWRVTPARVRGRIPFQIREGTDKLTQLQRFLENGVSCPEFTSDPAVARDWATPATPVVCRTLLRASEGRGVVIAESPEQLSTAPLYTKYFKKKREYRVHVFNGQVIDVQEKRKRKEVEGGDHRIRNLANGYVFCREAVVEPTGLRDLAVCATAALGYSLGAVDIAFNEHHNQLVVFEVNAAPGMVGSTLENYANAIVGWYKEQLDV